MDIVTIKDFFSKDMVSDSVNVLDSRRMLMSIGLALVLGLFILFIYNKTYAGVLYSKSFAFSLVLLTMITTLVMLPITSNISLSLGMVGALSIIRFRTAVKDAMDAMFLFWGVAIGICLGASFYAVAIVGGLLIGLSTLILHSIKVTSSMPYLIVLHFRNEATSEVNALIATLPKSQLKSKVARRENIEMTIEARLNKKDENIVERFTRIRGVHDATLMSYQGAIIS